MSIFDIFKSKPKEPARLCFSTDIHCHVVPGIDDGARDPETGADLVEAMQAWGIKRIIASPHITQGTFPNTPETIAPALKKLNDVLEARGNSLRVETSAENRIDEILYKSIDEDTLVTMPKGYILIENSFVQEPWNLHELVFNLQLKGLQPILAHPERYSYYYGNRKRYRELHDTGLLFQINLLSLTGIYGKEERKIAEYLIKNEMVDLIGTDVHRKTHTDAIDAYLRTSTAHKDMEALEGTVLNDRIFPADDIAS